MAPVAQLIMGAVHPLEDWLQAYRSGSGVPFSQFGKQMREGQTAFECLHDISHPVGVLKRCAAWQVTMGR